MTMANPSLQDIPDMEVLLHCPICTDPFNDPKLLPCGHTFCANCIQQLMNVASQGQFTRILRQFNCPVCRRPVHVPVGGMQGFQNDFRVEQIKDAFEAVARAVPGERGNCDFCQSQKREVSAQFSCIQCHKQMCAICERKHADRPHFMNHTVVRKDHKQKGILCKDHQEDCAFVCTECSKMVCVMCVMTTCSGHDHAIEELKNVAAQRKKEIKSIASIVQMRMAEMEHSILQISFLENSKTKMLDDLETAIKKQMDEVVSKVRQNGNDLLNTVDEYKREVIGEIQAARSETELELGMLVTMRDAVESASEPGMEVQLVAAYPSMKSRIANKASYTYEPSKKTSSRLIYRPADGLKVGSVKTKRDGQLITAMRNLDTTGEVHSVVESNGSGDEIVSNNEAKNTSWNFLNCAAAQSRTLTLSRRATNRSRSVHGSVEDLDETPYLHSSMSWQITGLGDGCDITFLPNGNMAITDTREKKVVLYNHEGDVLADSKRSNINNVFQKPKGITYHTDMQCLLVADSELHCLKVLDPNNLQYRRDITLSQVQEPCGIAVLSGGKIVITEASENRHGVSIHSEQGACRKMWGTKGSHIATLRSRWFSRSPEIQFSDPLYTAVDRHDRIIVSDMSNSIVHFFDCEGRLLHRYV